MARVAINTGATPNDGSGDTLRAAGGIINSNFLELYSYLGAGSTTTLSAPVWNTTNAGINTLRNVGIGTTNPRFALEVGAVGSSGTSLYVNGDARVTGILTVGTASITLDGVSNKITVGSGVTIDGTTGIISATSIVLNGSAVTGAGVTSITAGSGISVNQSTGNVTITATGGGGGGTSYWEQTAAGINTLSNVGIGTTNPTSALTVKGTSDLENVTVSGVSTLTTTDLTGNITLKATGGNSSLYVYDDNSVVFGNGNDLTISHSSSNSVTRIREDGGNLEISANPIELQHSDSTKLETLGAGVTITGTTFTDQLSVSGVSTIGGTLNGVYFTNIGGGNIAIGQDSLLNHTSGQNSIGIGYRALYNASNSNFSNIAVGYQAGYNIGIGVLNSFFGYNSGRLITGGSGNVILGSFDGNSFGLDIRNADNYIILSANGQTGSNDTAPKLVIDPNGNTGIGTTNTTEKLTVAGIVSATSFYGSNTLKSRTIVSATTGSIGAGNTENLSITGYKSYSLLKVGISSAAWVVLYTDADSRTSDASRSYLTDPTPGSGVIAEVRTTTAGISTFIMSPGIIGWNNDVSVGSTIYAKVTNNESSSAAITVDLTVVKLED